MIKIAITKDIEKFLQMIEKVYNDILRNIYENLLDEIKNT